MSLKISVTMASTVTSLSNCDSTAHVMQAETREGRRTCLKVFASTLDSVLHVVDRFRIVVTVQDLSKAGSLPGECFGRDAHFPKLANDSLVHDAIRTTGGVNAPGQLLYSTNQLARLIDSSLALHHVRRSKRILLQSPLYGLREVLKRVQKIFDLVAKREQHLAIRSRILSDPLSLGSEEIQPNCLTCIFFKSSVTISRTILSPGTGAAAVIASLLASRPSIAARRSVSTASPFLR